VTVPRRAEVLGRASDLRATSVWWCALTGIGISMRYGAAAHDAPALLSDVGGPTVPTPASARAMSTSLIPCASAPVSTVNASSMVGLLRREPLRDPGCDPGRDPGCDRDMAGHQVSQPLDRSTVRLWLCVATACSASAPQTICRGPSTTAEVRGSAAQRSTTLDKRCTPSTQRSGVDPRDPCPSLSR
jgi:hypothetical protein